MQGFTLTTGNKHYVLISDKKNITDAIAKKFIVKILDCRNCNTDTINEYLNNKCVINDIKYRISKCEYEEVKTDTTHYYKISGKYFYIAIRYEERDNIVIFE